MVTPKILVSWYTDPTAIPPFVLAKDQVTVGPKLRPGQPRMMFAGQTPTGVYDLKAALDIQRLPTRYDLIVVYADASDMNCPLNLRAFGCPTLLVVGDTHHLERPLQKMIAYAKDASFDFIVSLCNRHHLHWFSDAGFGRVAWFPGLAIRHVPRPWQDTRKRQIGFAGQIGKLHPRRLRLLERLGQAGLPLVAGTVSRDASADRHAESLVSFNASLNGDLNFRVFEVLSAGGCLLTDRLAPDAGLDLLLTEGTHYAGYDDADELVAKAEHLLAHPEEARAMAQAGHAAFMKSMLPQQRAADLLAWIFDGTLDALYRAPARAVPSDPAVSLDDRLRVYERLQQLHLERERPRVLFEPEVPEIYRIDAADLRRLDSTIGTRAETAATQWDAVISAGPQGVTCSVL